jgi:hypothetical protein
MRKGCETDVKQEEKVLASCSPSQDSPTETKQEETLCDTCKTTCAGLCGRLMCDCLEFEKLRSRHEKELKEMNAKMSDFICKNVCCENLSCRNGEKCIPVTEFERVFGEKKP